jgi:DNA-binding XRE family transcriptional regulator
VGAHDVRSGREEPVAPPEGEELEVLPVVVLSKRFPARPSSIPDIRDFVQRCLVDSPVTPEGNRDLQHAVSQALLDAASPTGTIQVSFRIFPDHVEVDVLRSQPHAPSRRPLKLARVPAEEPPKGQLPAGRRPETFAEWMAALLEQQGLSKEQAAKQLGVSVKTVSRWIGGETEPRFRDLRRIREVFGDVPFL